MSKGVKLNHPFLLNEIYNDIENDVFCKGENLNSFFINTLKKVGYNITNVSTISFNDKSII